MKYLLLFVQLLLYLFVLLFITLSTSRNFYFIRAFLVKWISWCRWRVGVPSTRAHGPYYDPGFQREKSNKKPVGGRVDGFTPVGNRRVRCGITDRRVWKIRKNRCLFSSPTYLGAIDFTTTRGTGDPRRRADRTELDPTAGNRGPYAWRAYRNCAPQNGASAVRVWFRMGRAISRIPPARCAFAERTLSVWKKREKKKRKLVYLVRVPFSRRCRTCRRAADGRRNNKKNCAG